MSPFQHCGTLRLGVPPIKILDTCETGTCLLIDSISTQPLFTPNGKGIIYIDNSTAVLATIVFDLLLMISVGLLIGINIHY